MISFRFHVISVVAVFLALAVGIVIGSTVIDQTIVGGLRDRVEDVRANLDARQEANDRLSEEVDHLEAFVEDGGALAVEGRLDDTAAVVITDRGIDGGPVERTVALLGQAGAGVRAVLTLDDSWTLEEAETREALAAAISLDPSDPVEALQAGAASELVAELSSAEGVGGDDDDLLDTVAELQLADLELVDDVVVDGPSQVVFVVVTGPDSDLEDPDHILPFLTAAADRAGGVVLGEVFREADQGPERGDSMQNVLEDPVLSAAVTTVDDLDLPQGPATVVLALAVALEGTVGHYGVGDDVERSAPLPPEPS